jgi:DNA-binding CsgD family transcriptional regulator/pimeloyl-ACP methyl ester carboxylesterase
VARFVTPYLRAVVLGIGGLALDEVPFATTPVAAMAFGLIDRSGRIRACDLNFTGLGIGEAGVPSLLRLVTQAARGQPALGILEVGSGGVIAVCVATPAGAVAWPMGPVLRSTLDSASEQFALMAYAPARASDLALSAVAAFRFSELEARVAVAMLEAPTIEIAAARVGVGRETARDALAGAMRKMGVRRTPLLIRRMTDLICGETFPVEGDHMREALGLTAAEAKTARLTAQGSTTASVARTLGVKPETVKSHLRSAFSKVGLARAKDLSRLDVELGALHALSRAREMGPLMEPAGGMLRMLVRPDDRRVAFLDYGPASGRLVLVMHALASGRTLPPDLARCLKSAGYRPVVPQRPGYGLTDPPSGDYLADAAEDMAAILVTLKRGATDVLARDIATAALLAFAQRFPSQVDHVVLLNPERETNTVAEAKPMRSYAIPAAARLLQRHPELTRAFFEVLRRQTGSARLAPLLVESFKSGSQSDIEGLRDPEILAWMVRDIQAMVARSITGIVQERLSYAGGWHAPANIGGRAWTIARSAELGPPAPEPWWQALPQSRVEILAVGGLLTPVTHPECLVALLTASRSGVRGQSAARAGT